MTTKSQAYYAGIFAAVTQFIGWFIALPPNQQTATIAPIIAVVPVQWQSSIAVLMKSVGAISLVYATVKASQSGPGHPPTPPVQPPAA